MNKEQTIEAIKCASKFMARGDVRHYLNGICLEFNFDHMIVTATDGHRLFNCIINNSQGNHSITAIGQYIISGDDVLKILKLYDYKKDKSQVLDFELDTDGRDIIISDGKISYAMTPVDGKYPDYNLAIPKFDSRANDGDDTHVTFGMNMVHVAEAMKALQPLGNQKYKGAKFTIGDANSSCLIEVNGPDFKTLENIRAVIMPMRL